MPRHTILHSLVLSALLLSGVGCAHNREVEDAPDWATKKGAEQTKFAIAEALLDAGSVEAAQQIIAQIQADGGSSPELDYLQGRTLIALNLASEAEPLLRRAADRMPRDPRPLRSLGLLYADLHRLDEAVDAFARACKINHQDAATWNNLGFVYTARGDHAEAVKALRNAVAADSSNPRYRNNLGFALFQNNQFDDALRAFQSTGSEADAFSNLGLAYELNGNADLARREYERALDHSPNHSSAVAGLQRLQLPMENR